MILKNFLFNFNSCPYRSLRKLPLLIKEGFQDKIICTKPTSQITRIMLLNAAKVMREHYKTLYKKSVRKGLDLPPLYFKIMVSYETPLFLEGNIKITFKDAGHILGSAFVEIEDLETHKKITFSR